MLYNDKIDAFEGTDVNKTSESKECDICHYWYIFNKRFTFQPNVWDGCHYLLMVSMDLSDIAILNIKSVDRRCIISGISKSDAKKSWTLWNIKFMILYKNG